MRNLFGEILSAIIVIVFLLFILAIIMLPILGMFWLIVSLLTSKWFWIGASIIIFYIFIKEL